MAQRIPSKAVRFLEYMVSRPPLATLTVGFSILLLLFFTDFMSNYLPFLSRLKYLIPFIPPFFITRMARRINMKKAEFNFIADAEPIIYVGYPKSPSVNDLLKTYPEAVSDSTARHLNLPIYNILRHPILPETRFSRQVRQRVFSELLAAPAKADNRRVLQNYIIETLPYDDKTMGKEFILNAVLKPQGRKWKLQLTLIPKNFNLPE